MNLATSSKPPRYSVVIVTYNSRENIQVCLDSLRRCAKTAENGSAIRDQEIIVVDNNSRDGTPEFLSSQKDVRSILNKTNNGFSKGCNQGAEIATGTFLIFLNPDTLVTPGWNDDMARYFQDPSVGAVGPVSNYVAGLQRLDLNLPPKWRDATQFPGTTPTEIANNVAGILKEANAGRGVITKILIGFCMMMQRSLYTAMGGMDENLFLGNDDLDLSWRLRNNGRKLVVASDAFVFHEGQKSFKTEAKSHVDRLTQESTDAMYVKLVNYYGAADKVPSAIDLWGMDWFKPSPSLIEEMKSKPRKPEAKMKSETQGSNTWKGISVLIFLGPDRETAGAETAAARLERSLSTLPSRPSPDILILNCSGQTVTSETPIGAIRTLDLGAACTPKQALEIAIHLLPGSHALYCIAGVEFSTLFNHWLDKRNIFTVESALHLPLRIEEADLPDVIGAEESLNAGSVTGFAFLSRNEWLNEALEALARIQEANAFLVALNSRITNSTRPESSGKSFDPPWLLVNAGNLPAAKKSSPTPTQENMSSQKPELDTVAQTFAKLISSSAPASSQAFGNLLNSLKSVEKSAPEKPLATTPTAAPAPSSPGAKVGDTIALYPDSLQFAMREAKNIGFAGTAAEPVTVKGSLNVYDSKGDLVPLADQDLVILRVTPEMIEKLDERLRNIRQLARNLKRLILICDGNQALRTPRSHLIPMDLTPEGIRAALLLAGFTATNIQPYRGFPEGVIDGSVPEGWFQVESIPRETSYCLEKMVSIVILGFNQVEYTKKCIESIRKHTRQKYELIIIDNGSRDGTEAYFRSIPNAKVIINRENLGVAKGWNQGMRLAEGEYILILNNDIIVGPNWLENMVRLAESDPTIGLVGPRSNYIAGPQVVSNVSYKVEGEIQDFIRKWQGDHDLSAAEFGFIKGFCHLIPRRVFTKVGFYDERFGKGNFEDDDYCMRVHHHGFRAVFASDSFIHHYGSVSFKQDSVDWQALMIENQKKYVDKWAKGPAAIHDTVVAGSVSGTPIANPVTSDACLRALEEGKQAYTRGEIQAAGEKFLEAQGKDPKNPETYGNLGVVQFHLGKYQDATALFLQCLTLDPNNVDAAINLLECITTVNGKVAKTDISTLRTRFPSNQTIAAFAREQTSDQETGIVAKTPAAPPTWQVEMEALIEASNYSLAIDLLETKIKANQELGACYNFLGIIAHACGDTEEALKHFTTAAKHSPSEPDIIYNLADTHVTLGRPFEAETQLRECGQNHGEDPSEVQADFTASAEQIAQLLASGKFNADAYFASRDANRKGEGLLRDGNPTEAVSIFQSALQTDPQDFRALNNLGLVAWYQGEAELAMEYFVKCLSIRPIWLDAAINAFDAALSLGRIDHLRPVLDRALTLGSPNHNDFLAMRTHIHAEGPAIYSANSFAELQAGSVMLKRAEEAMNGNRKNEAINIYLDALKTRPKHPQALNGLGIIAFGEKRFEDAFGLFEAAADLHPLDQDILLNLWQSAKALNREKEVLPKLRLSLEQNPDLEEVKAVVKEYA